MSGDGSRPYVLARASAACAELLRVGLASAVALILAGSAAHAASPMSLPGSFDVTPTGNATYSIPIEVPPGTAGMAPALTLQYDSNGPNGLFGPGWSLGGIPSITRCPRQWPQGHQQSAGVKLDITDGFCLGGNRLIAIGGSAGYGLDNTEYRTEIDSQTKIISHAMAGNGPAYFEVRTKSGQIMYFGSTYDSQVLVSGNPTPRAWMVDRIEDTVGNYMSFTYYADPASGMVWPKTIYYGGNLQNGQGHYNQVTFDYTTRGDPQMSFEGGGMIYNPYAITNIKAWTGVNSAATLVNDYRLGYQNGASWSGPVSRLGVFVRCDGSGTCLPGTSFGWTSAAINQTNGSQGFPFSNTYTTTETGDFGSPPHAYYTPITGDFNGDGKVDFLFVTLHMRHVFISNGDGSFYRIDTPHGNGWTFGMPPHAGYTPIVGDFNGDGRTDYMFLQGAIQHVSLSNGNGTFTDVQSVNPPGWNFGTPHWYYAPITGDFNGDGKTDYALIHTNQIYVLFSNGDGNFTAVFTYNPSGWSFGSPPSAQFTVLSGDYNGDGKTDYLMLYQNQQYCMLSNGDGSFTTRYGDNGWYFGSPPDAAFTPIVGDFNGDGKTDYMFTQNNVQYVMFSKGDGTFIGSGSLNGGWYFGGPPAANFTPIPGDFNGDGKSDYMFVQYDVLYIQMSNGNGTFSSIGAHNPLGYNFGAPPTNYVTPIVGDFGGDGKTDFAFVRNTHVNTFLTDGGTSNGLPSGWTPSQEPFSRLNAIFTGIGAVTTIKYEPLTANSGVYSGSCCPAYPLSDVRPSTFVVREVSTSNGNGGMVAQRYAYTNMLADATRGFLGFSQVMVADLQTGILSLSEYEQSYPFTGMLRWRQIKNGASVLNQVSNSYARISTASPLGGNTEQIFLVQSVQSGTDLDGVSSLPTVTTWTDYDAYANAVRVVITTAESGGNSSKTTYNTVSNNASTWQLGRITASQTVHTLPDGTSQTRTAAFAYHPTTGLLTQEVIEQSDSALFRDTQYVHDSFGNRVSITVTAANGGGARTTTASYSEPGSYGRFATKVTNALGQIATRTFDPRFGTVMSATDANGVTASATYDGFGRKISETPPGQPTRTSVYVNCSGCSNGNGGSGGYYVVTTATGSPQTRTFFDSLNREYCAETDGYDGPNQVNTNPIHTRTHYDSNGRVWKRFLPHFANLYPSAPYVLTVYDALGRVTRETAPDGSYVQSTYNGLVTRKDLYDSTNANLGWSQTHKNYRGQVSATQDPAGWTYFEHDHFGNLTKTTDVAGNVTTMTYDRRGRKTGMVDRDLGAWSYTYDGFDQLRSQTDAKAQVSTMSYDVLGRMTQRVEGGVTSTWTYDTATNGKGKLASASDSNGYLRSHVYDSLSRPTQVTTTIDGGPYTLGYGYDATTGKPTTVTYPNGLVTRNVYTARGYFQKVVDHVSGATYWQSDIVDAAGNITLQSHGNGVVTAKAYDPLTNRLTAIQTGAGNAIQNLTYAWDTRGNLTQRDDGNVVVGGTDHLKEMFAYDLTNRLTGTTFNNGVTAKSYAYDAMGNITSKSDVGTFTYNAPGATSVRPHAVASVTGTVNGVTNPAFTYDANGNMTDGAGRTIVYTAFNLPISITQGATVLSWTYDPERGRIKEVGPNGTNIYLNPRADAGVYVLKKLNASGIGYRWENHIYAAGQSVAIQFDATNDPADGTKKIRYLHKDHLGSTHVLTDEATAARVDPVTPVPPTYAAFSYDAFGKRRNVDGSDATGPIASATNRGFTGHEHLEEVGLIHMNGRIYDPELGRFMTGDPNVQAPMNSQSYNRYSYVLNNPLSLSDPSGFFFGSLFKALFKFHAKIVQEVGKGIVNYVEGLVRNPAMLVAMIAVAVVTWGVGAAIISTTQAAVAGIEAGIITVETALVTTTSAGTMTLTAAGQAVAGAAGGFVGGIISGASARGADIGSVFRSAVLGAAAGGISAGVGAAVAKQGVEVQLLARASAGGVTSVIGGGKFENGAVSAAFAYLTTPDTSESGGAGGPDPEGSGSKSSVTGPEGNTWFNPTDADVRGCDRQWGCGYFGAGRGSRSHEGTDYLAYPGQDVVAVTSGTVTRLGYPYANSTEYRYVEITTGNGYVVRQMYVSPAVALNTNVLGGQAIGTAQSLQPRYRGIPDHIHVEIKWNNQTVNPQTLIP